MVFPMKGICLIQESCHCGGVPAFAMRVSLGAVPGNETSGDSGTIQFGHSIDQSTVFGGSVLSSCRFCRCSRKIGKLWLVSVCSHEMSFVGLPVAARMHVLLVFQMRVDLLIGQHRLRSRVIQHTLSTQDPHSQRTLRLYPNLTHGIEHRAEDHWQVALCPGS